MAIARVALPVATNRLFDYWLPEGLRVEAGSVVRVTLGRRRAIGVAVEIVDRSTLLPEQLVPIQEVVTELPPLPEDVCSLAKFVSAYYQQAIGPCFLDTLPPLGAGRKSRRMDRIAVGPKADPATKPLELNPEQRAA